jgi:hypothetical protein
MNNIVHDDTIKVVASSKVASLLTDDVLNGTPERQEFGKRFEQAYQHACWVWKGIPWKRNAGVVVDGNCPKCGKPASSRFSECGLCHRRWHPGCGMLISVENAPVPTCKDCTGQAIIDTFKEKMGDSIEGERIAAAFFGANIRGLNPSTVFREIPGNPGYFISAKPDLVTSTGTWYEFKTYAIRGYAIAQCNVFSWVIGRPVTLVGWDGTTVQKRVVDGKNVEIPEIPEEWFSTRETPDIANYATND